jgi:hypothetical protein
VPARFCAKGSLYGLLHSPGCYLSWVEVVGMLLGAARGMEHLHAHSVLHRCVCVCVCVAGAWGACGGVPAWPSGAADARMQQCMSTRAMRALVRCGEHLMRWLRASRQRPGMHRSTHTTQHGTPRRARTTAP